MALENRAWRDFDPDCLFLDFDPGRDLASTAPIRLANSRFPYARKVAPLKFGRSWDEPSSSGPSQRHRGRQQDSSPKR